MNWTRRAGGFSPTALLVFFCALTFLAGRSRAAESFEEALSLGRALSEKGEFVLARQTLDRALARAAAPSASTDADLGFARVHLALARLESKRGMVPEIPEHLRLAEEYFAGRATPAEEAELRFVHACHEVSIGSTGDGISRLFEAFELSAEAGADDLRAAVCMMLTSISSRQYDYDSSDHYIRFVEEYSRGAGGALWGARAEARRARVHVLQGELSTAEAKYERALELAKVSGDRRTESRTLFGLGHAARARDRVELAEDYYERSMQVALETQYLSQISRSAASIARMRLELGDPKGALAVLDEHRGVFETTESPRLRILHHRHRGLALAALGRHEEAFESMFLAADTERWLAPEESSAGIIRRTLEDRAERERAARETFTRYTLLGALGALLVLGIVLRSHRAAKRTNQRLENALAEVKALRDLLPMCASCKAVRDDDGSWRVLEEYLLENANARVSHGLCPSCVDELYPEVAKAPR